MVYNLQELTVYLCRALAVLGSAGHNFVGTSHCGLVRGSSIYDDEVMPESLITCRSNQ